MCDVGLLTPDCVDFLFARFPSLESLFIARNLLKGRKDKAGAATSGGEPSSSSSASSPDIWDISFPGIACGSRGSAVPS